MAKPKSDVNRASKARVRDARREFIDDTLGKVCEFCSRDINLATHRKDGTEHEKFQHKGLAWVKSEVTREKYVRLCYPCHKGVHWAMRFLDLDWESIVDRQRTVGVVGARLPV